MPDPLAIPPLLDPDRQRWDGSDVLQSFGSGLASGAGTIAGLPGDLQTITQRLARLLLQPFGYQGPTQEEMDRRYAESPYILPSSSDMHALIEARTGPPHQPQTTMGGTAYKVGQAIPVAPVAILTGRMR